MSIVQGSRCHSVALLHYAVVLQVTSNAPCMQHIAASQTCNLAFWPTLFMQTRWPCLGPAKGTQVVCVKHHYVAGDATTPLSILAHSGMDCTEEFHHIHRNKYPLAYKQLPAFHIGKLVPGCSESSVASEQHTAGAEAGLDGPTA